MLYYLTKKCLKISLYAFGWGAIALCTLLIYLFAQLPDVTSLSSYQYKVPMRIYSADHELIAEFGQSDCLPIGIEDIPIQVQQAIVAIEDHRFYDHWGSTSLVLPELQGMYCNLGINHRVAAPLPCK